MVIAAAAVITAFLTRRAVTFIIEGLLVLLFLIELEGLDKVFSQISIIVSLN